MRTMRAVTAGLVTTIAAAALGLGAMQGSALAEGAAGSPSAGDSGAAAGRTVVDLLDALRSAKHENGANPGTAY